MEVSLCDDIAGGGEGLGLDGTYVTCAVSVHDPGGDGCVEGIESIYRRDGVDTDSNRRDGERRYRWGIPSLIDGSHWVVVAPAGQEKQGDQGAGQSAAHCQLAGGETKNAGA